MSIVIVQKTLDHVLSVMCEQRARERANGRETQRDRERVRDRQTEKQRVMF